MWSKVKLDRVQNFSVRDDSIDVQQMMKVQKLDSQPLSWTLKIKDCGDLSKEK